MIATDDPHDGCFAAGNAIAIATLGLVDTTPSMVATMMIGGRDVAGDQAADINRRWVVNGRSRMREASTDWTLVMA